jgi:hypothetical protein
MSVKKRVQVAGDRKQGILDCGLRIADLKDWRQRGTGIRGK